LPKFIGINSPTPQPTGGKSVGKLSQQPVGASTFFGTVLISVPSVNRFGAKRGAGVPAHVPAGLVDLTGQIGYLKVVTTLSEIEKAIETLPLPERLRLYNDMPQLIGRDVEDLDWQRLAIEKFFEDDSSDDHVYDQV
jgi:hypothetical protein